jgi:hypothetical protein
MEMGGGVSFAGFGSVERYCDAVRWSSGWPRGEMKNSQVFRDSSSQRRLGPSPIQVLRILAGRIPAAAGMMAFPEIITYETQAPARLLAHFCAGSRIGAESMQISHPA